MHCSTEVSGDTVSTGVVMMSRTGVSLEERPSRITLRAVVALGHDAGEHLALHDQERPDVMLGHGADRLQHGVSGPTENTARSLRSSN